MSGEFEYALRSLLTDVVREQIRKALADELPLLLKEAMGVATAESDDAYVTMQRAATIAQVSPASIRNWIRRGVIKEYRAGRLVRIRLADLHRYLARPPETAAAVSVEEAVQKMFTKAHRWEQAKTEALAEATARGETLNQHQLRSRTHSVLRR